MIVSFRSLHDCLCYNFTRFSFFAVYTIFVLIFFCFPLIKNRSRKPLCIKAFGFGGEQGIRTLEQALTCYTISNRAPSASSDNSPYTAGARCVRVFTFNPRPGSKRRTDTAFPQTYPWTAAWGWGWDNGQ